MRKPTEIIILGISLKVSYRKRLPDGCMGMYFPDDSLILVKNNSEWKSTLFHELLHAALEITKANKKLNYKKEEMIVANIEEALHEVVSVVGR